RRQGNESWAAKQPAYTQSGFELTKRLAAENTDWTPERVAARQSWMARQAVSIWRIAQLS
ncbi:MAG: DUF1524 domain-containing protein, partial [Blastocatellia bacterium]